MNTNFQILFVVLCASYWQLDYDKKISNVLGKRGHDWTFRTVLLQDGSNLGVQIIVPTQAYHSYSSEMLKKIMCLQLKLGIKTN